MSTFQDLDDTIAIAQRDPQFFVNGQNLTDAQRAVIKPQDTWEIALIDSLHLADQEAIGRCFAPLDLRHYNDVQVQEWFGTQKFLIARRTGGPVDETALIQDAEVHQNLVRYRLCYTLNFPFKIALNTIPYVRCRSAVDAFLATAELLHPFRYPYYTTLWTNGLLNQSRRP